jgi:hydrogenase maturation protease
MSGGVAQQGAARKVLVACLGNPDRGDDGIGALVARLIDGRLPTGAVLLRRSGDMLALLEDWAGFDAVVCVDAAAATGRPGRIRRIDMARETLPTDKVSVSGHAFGLAEAIKLARTLGSAPAHIVVYAIEGKCFDTGALMSAEVEIAADDAARRVIDEIA